MSTALAQSADKYDLYIPKQFAVGKETLQYRVLYPSDYDINKKYPLIIVLHGAGERGDDNISQLTHGGNLFLDSTNRVKFPAFVVFPQCPANDFWAKIDRTNHTTATDSLGGFSFISTGQFKPALGLVSKLIDSLAATPQINTKKIYIGGLSMGGMGTFEMLWRKPDFFAAAFPICGGGDPQKVKLYAQNFPIWVFHGDKDAVVPVSHSRRMVNALKESGAKVKYSEYTGVNHNSWDNAFAEPGLLEWLLNQEKL